MKRAVILCALPVAANLLVGCTQFPELERTQTAALEAADYPALVPLDPLLARTNIPGPDAVQTEARLNTRLASLRNRANAMRGSVLSGTEKQRLERGLR